MPSVQHDTAASIHFLEMMFEDLPVHLVAIHTDARVEAATFETAGDQRAFEWIEARQSL